MFKYDFEIKSGNYSKPGKLFFLLLFEICQLYIFSYTKSKHKFSRVIFNVVCKKRLNRLVMCHLKFRKVKDPRCPAGVRYGCKTSISQEKWCSLLFLINTRRMLGTRSTWINGFVLEKLWKVTEKYGCPSNFITSEDFAKSHDCSCSPLWFGDDSFINWTGGVRVLRQSKVVLHLTSGQLTLYQSMLFSWNYY